MATVSTEAASTGPRPEIVPLNSPEPGKPMWHDLTCGRCGWPFSHTDMTVIHCGLCRMDETNHSYIRRYARRMV